MTDASGRPQRMRYSFETRCRAVTAMVAGVSPAAALASSAATLRECCCRCSLESLRQAPSPKTQVSHVERIGKYAPAPAAV